MIILNFESWRVWVFVRLFCFFLYLKILLIRKRNLIIRMNVFCDLGGYLFVCVFEFYIQVIEIYVRISVLEEDVIEYAVFWSFQIFGESFVGLQIMELEFVLILLRLFVVRDFRVFLVIYIIVISIDINGKLVL